MSFHQKITEKISMFLDFIYYKNIIILKPDYFIYLQYYFTYTFFYYITNKNILLYSTSLHLIHINNLLFKNLCLKYNYKPKNNIKFIKNINYLLFMYLFLIKLIFIKKIYILTNILIFYIFYIINILYKKRLKCIENKKDFTYFSHFFKLLIITPNKKNIENIIYYTSFFSYSNYLIFINILLYFMN
jgi:hypothetical protein